MIKYPDNTFYKELDKELQNMCRLFDKICDIEVIATSGLRDPEKNANVGGISTSSHLKGLAIDLFCDSGAIRHKVIFCAMAVGFKRIGVGKTHIHLDCDESKPFPTLFFDNYTPPGN